MMMVRKFPVARRVVLTSASIAALLVPMALSTASRASAATAPATAAKAPVPPTPATMARLAQKALLLGAAWAGDRLVVVGDRGEILLSDDARSSAAGPDGAPHWRQVPVPDNAALTAVTFANAHDGWAVGHDAVILHTSDGGENWNIQNFHPEWEQPLMDVRFSTPRDGMAVGAYGLFLETHDGGQTWARRKIEPDDLHLNALFALPLPAGAPPDTPPTLVIAGEAGNILISHDGGQAWVRMPTPYDGSFFGGLPLGPDSFLVYGLQGHVLRTDDGGKTWRTLDTGTKAVLMGGTRAKGGEVVLVGALGAMLTSRDDAHSFQLYNRPDRDAEAHAVALGDGRLLLLGDQGLQVVPVPTSPTPATPGG